MQALDVGHGLAHEAGSEAGAAGGCGGIRGEGGAVGPACATGGSELLLTRRLCTDPATDVAGLGGRMGGPQTLMGAEEEPRGALT